MPMLDTYDAVSRFFPSRDKRQAFDFLRWLDRCGYTIVSKKTIEETSLVPEHAEREQEYVAQPR